MDKHKIKAFFSWLFTQTDGKPLVEKSTKENKKSIEQLYKEREEKIILESNKIKSSFYEKYQQSLGNKEATFSFSWTSTNMKYWDEKIFKQIYKKLELDGCNVQLEKKVEYVNGTNKKNETLTMLLHVKFPQNQLKKIYRKYICE